MSDQSEREYLVGEIKNSVVSCIVPVFNGERYVQEALESISSQTYRPLEIIVVDDGSTDNTHEVVRSLGISVQYIEQVNMGPAAARNFGISLAKGDFVAFLDSDDLWHQEKLSKQMARFQAKPEAEICITHISHFEDSEVGRKDSRYYGHRRLDNIPGYVTQTLLARRTTFDKVGIFDSTLRHGDANDWFVRVADCGLCMELLPEVLVYRRLHATNFSSQGRSVSLAEHLKIIKASLDRRRQIGGGNPQPYQFPTSSFKNDTITQKEQ